MRFDLKLGLELEVDMGPSLAISARVLTWQLIESMIGLGRESHFGPNLEVEVDPFDCHLTFIDPKWVEIGLLLGSHLNQE